MKFVIVGYGRVGTRTCRVLKEEGHEVVVVDHDPDAAERARMDGFEAYQGDPTDEAVFDEVDFSTVDAVGGLTSDVNANFAVCTIGNHHGCRTVMRIDEDYRTDIYDKYASGVDDVIYPERLGAAGAKTALLGGDFNVVADLTEKLQLTKIKIPERSPAVGNRLSEIGVPEEAQIYAHGRAGSSMTIPLPGTELEAGDEVAVIADRAIIDEVHDVLIGEQTAS